MGYRDLEDEKRFEFHPFTKDMEALKKFVASLVADGGGDACEDTIGAFEKAFKEYEFSSDGYNIVFLICDAPCHGS